MKTLRNFFGKGNKKTRKLPDKPDNESPPQIDVGIPPATPPQKVLGKTLPPDIGKGHRSPPRETPPEGRTMTNTRAKFTDPKTGSTYTVGSPAVKPPGSRKVRGFEAEEKKKVNDHVAPSGLEISTEDSLPTSVWGETAVTNTQCEEFIDSPITAKAYESVPILEQTKLPRGGVSVHTDAVGPVQYGIPPETIKDSMTLGMPVPQVYIVPAERFCREMGPALGVNLAEFEFPAYFNFFVYKKKCTLVVDSSDAEENIRRVFSETLLGPEQFRRDDFISYEEDDFAPDFPKSAIPDFQKELKHFRIMPDGKELCLELLLDFKHYEFLENPTSLGVPKPPTEVDAANSVADGATLSDDEVQAEVLAKDLNDVEKREEQQNPWTFSQAAGMGDVARVYPAKATAEEIASGKVPRVEIFKMPGGTEYIIHDIDENNHIIGKAKLSGHVRVSEFMSVDGFGGRSFLDAMDPSKDETQLSTPAHPIASKGQMPSFHPPSFGVTVLGNSHGFDKSGSVSGYVLWINGRGVMIDPPPYSSATLEREGIRPRTIVGIILTHCHADHDAGAFQKVLTGSPVVVITTRTIYKSFIRKYSALSALSPALLRHSHRFKPAVIGEPLRFQGATFRFTYTLHAIPCVGFKVEWRGRSMVFTGDHFNSPVGIEKLQEKGVLSKARADDLNYLPLQDCDLLLHESGAPPIHTPLDVLLQLPKHVKERLYVVHTSALPADCELKVAPTGTAGTIRLDDKSAHSKVSLVKEDEDNLWNGEYSTIAEESDDYLAEVRSSIAPVGVVPPLLGGGRGRAQRNSVFSSGGKAPLVSLRPASSTDAWYILNLLSAVPFLSSLSYASTMEVLETARVDAYALHSVVVPAVRRSQVLCVVWEGTCAERPVGKSGILSTPSSSMLTISEDTTKGRSLGSGPIWHAGDWTAPRSLQPDERLSGESSTCKTHDIVAMSAEGVKVITIDFGGLHTILNSGSKLYRRFLERNLGQERARQDSGATDADDDSVALNKDKNLEAAKRELNVLELLNCNSALRKLTAVQKRHLESLAVGPVSYQQGERLWGAGTPVDKAFIIISGTASFVIKRRGASVADIGMKKDAETAMKELGVKHDDHSSMSSAENDDTHKMAADAMHNDYKKLQKNLQSKADRDGQFQLQTEGSVSSGLSGFSGDSVSHEDGDYDSDDLDGSEGPARRSSIYRRRSSRMRQANKVLGRLYSRRAFTAGLVFSRGHFLGDVSKMVAGLLSSDAMSESGDGEPEYGFGDKDEASAEENALATITEGGDSEGDNHVMHSSTLQAGQNGCIVLVFPKSSLIPFLDDYPGLLLSLLGTQVIV